MSVTVECPECSEIREVSESKLGRKLKCPSCGKVFVAEEAVAARPRSASRSKKRARPKSSNAGVTIGLGVAGAVVVLLIGAFLLFGPGRRKNNADAPPAGVASSNPSGAASTTASTPPGQPASGDAAITARGAVVSAATGWMTPDPARESLDWTSDLKTLIESTPEEIEHVIPGLASPFFAMYGSSSLSVYDLRTSERVHHVDFPAMVTIKKALSPDGRWFAYSGILISAIPATGQSPELPFRVRSTESGLQTMETRPIPQQDTLRWMQFCSPSEVAVLGGHNNSNPKLVTCGAMVFNTTKVQPVSTFSIPDYIVETPTVLSPGGRFLIAQNGHAVGHPNQIVSLDLQTGRFAGRIDWHDSNERVELRGIAFSHDGKQITTVQRADHEFRIVLFDSTTGNKNQTIHIPGEPAELVKERAIPIGNGYGCSWLPDNRHLIFLDGMVVEVASGKVVADLSTKPGPLFQYYVVGQSLITLEVTPNGTRIRSKKIELSVTAGGTGN